jgi:hypothetical protein
VLSAGGRDGSCNSLPLVEESECFAYVVSNAYFIDIFAPCIWMDVKLFITWFFGEIDVHKKEPQYPALPSCN